eukprot:51586_1
MGNSDSKSKKKKNSGKKKGQSDDGCIGNRRVRTIILSAILIAFSVFALAYVFDIQEMFAEIQDVNDSAPEALQSDFVSNAYHSWNCVAAGLIITLAGAICAIVLFFIPGCDDKLGKVAGFVLILGGLLYIIGWIWFEVNKKNALQEEIFGVSTWDTYSDETKQRYNAGMWAKIGEALLMAISAILLGIDAMLQWYEDEAKRLSANLGLLLTVSIMVCNAYYLQICTEDDAICAVIGQADGVEAIATGYLIIFWVSLIYIILYICTCCTCDCKDNCIIRVILAIGLVVGGVLCSIGYYVYSGGFDDASNDDVAGKYVAFYIGYTILIGGLCIVWALDIALDDVRGA